jgi:hypothetical protein
VKPIDRRDVLLGASAGAIIFSTGGLPIEASTIVPTKPLLELAKYCSSGIGGVDGISGDPSPEFFISLDIQDVFPGNIVRLYVNGSLRQVHAISQEDIILNSINLALSELSDGAYSVTATIANSAGESPVSDAVAYVLKTGLADRSEFAAS